MLPPCITRSHPSPDCRTWSRILPVEAVSPGSAPEALARCHDLLRGRSRRSTRETCSRLRRSRSLLDKSLCLASGVQPPQWARKARDGHVRSKASASKDSCEMPAACASSNVLKDASCFLHSRAETADMRSLLVTSRQPPGCKGAWHQDNHS